MRDWLLTTILSSFIILFLTGMALDFTAIFVGGPWPTLAGLIILFLIPPAIYGALTALKQLRIERLRARLPQAIMVDPEKQVATVQRGNGEILSLQVPEEIMEEGPEAVVSYLIGQIE